MLSDELIALAEVAGRQSVRRLRRLRKAAGRMVRRVPAPGRPVTLAALEARILGLGYEPGRDLLVHAALVRQIEGSLDDLIAMLRRMVGPSATLLMPSHPLLTERNGQLVYDVNRSRSRVGLLSERFRRTPGVLRSRFPIASICAAGPRAAQYTSDFQERSGHTAYGPGSPYHMLAEGGGHVLYLGIDFIAALTLEHVAFDLLRGDHPIRDYYYEQEIVVDHDGTSVPVLVRDHRQELESRLATMAMRRMVMRSGTVRRSADGGVELAVMDARAFLDWHLPLARSRGWPYWTFPLAASRASS